MYQNISNLYHRHNCIVLHYLLPLWLFSFLHSREVGAGVWMWIEELTRFSPHLVLPITSLMTPLICRLSDSSLSVQSLEAGRLVTDLQYWLTLRTDCNVYLWKSSSQTWRFATLPETGSTRQDSGNIGLGCRPITMEEVDGSVATALSGLMGIP